MNQLKSLQLTITEKPDDRDSEPRMCTCFFTESCFTCVAGGNCNRCSKKWPPFSDGPSKRSVITESIQVKRATVFFNEI